MRNWWFHGKSLLLLPLLIFDPFIKQARDAQKEQYFFYVSSSNASRYMYGMHNALKMEQITARKGEHDSFQKNQPKMNFDFRSLCTLKLIMHFFSTFAHCVWALARISSSSISYSRCQGYIKSHFLASKVMIGSQVGQCPSTSSYRTPYQAIRSKERQKGEGENCCGGKV